MLHSQSVRAGRQQASVEKSASPISDAAPGLARRRRAAVGEPRVLFYSHDSYGLGHIRRTLSLCETVRGKYDRASLLVLTGSSAISTLPMPGGVDWVKLPSVTKVDNGEYRSRYLPLGFDAVRSLRRDIIYSTAQAYRPSLVFVDNVPLGLEGELRRTLEALRRWTPDVRIVLTLRDVLDEPERVIACWASNGTTEAIDRLYDNIIIYGSPDVFDVVREYRLSPALAAKCHYAGYIRREPQGQVAQSRARLSHGADRLVLVTVGGGGDGGPLIEQYLEGLEAAGARGVGSSVHNLVVCGPEMAPAERQTIRARHGHRRDVTVVDFSADLVTTMAAADVVVAMGGYNTICEILSLQKPAVVVPRRRPRLEQWIRCTRLAALGLLRVVHPDHDPATVLIREVRAALAGPPPATMALDLGGLTALKRLLPLLLTAPSA